MPTPSTWYADGGLAAFDAASGTLLAEKIALASSGAVDAGAVTRTQYATPGFNTRIAAVARIRLTYDDWFYSKASIVGGDINNEIYAMMYVAPVSAFSGTPTVAAIMDYAISSGSFMSRSNEKMTPPPSSPVGAYTDNLLHMNGPLPPSDLQPNTKYWAAVVPVQMKPSDPLSTAKRLYQYNVAQGRAVSFWTNRTPHAPTITGPASSIVIASGNSFTMTIAKGDDDSIFGGTTQKYTDTAGVHIQYAPRPTSANPNPTWIDLPFSNSLGSLVNRGWWISGSTGTGLFDTGVAALAQGPTVQIRCGSSSAPASQGLLPAGSWQIRVRTFDYGHPFPTSLNPLGNTAGSYNPSNYPAANTSPWSSSLIVTVTDQVPPPVPLFPTQSAAIPESAAITLSWQYRNTASPPFAQAKRSVQIRKVGDAVWTDLVVNQSSASAAILVTGFALVSGNQYEWRVQVTDTDNKVSNWSDVATFWMVPEPGSGGVRPVPSGTIDGATLGCGTHRVEIYRRGGRVRVGEIRKISHVDWERKRDDISTAQVVVTDWDTDDGNLLADLQTWAYELRITRDNGYSKDRVWEGPISLLTYEADKVTIHAKDVMNYAFRRIIKQAMTDTGSGDTVTSRAARVLQNVFAPDDPNLLSYLTVITRSDDAMEYRSTPAYSRTAFEEVDDMAANAGLDYTVVGRAIMLWGTKHRIGVLPEFRDKDLGAPPIVSEYGMSMANRYAVSDGNGIYGEATRLDENDEDPIYGLVEMVSSSWASDSEPESGTYTQDGLAKVIQSFEGYAERSIADRYPPPVIVRIPDNTTINPDTVISIQQLVPGVAVPLRSTGTLRAVVGVNKLDSIKVVEEGGKETITMTLSPFSGDDTDAGEEGEE